MYERFTDRARQVILQAHNEMLLLDKDCISTAELIRCLLRSEGAVAMVLVAADRAAIRQELKPYLVESYIEPPGSLQIGKLVVSVQVELLVRQAIDISRALHHKYIGTEHLLLACLQLYDLGACGVLRSGGLTYETVLDLLRVTQPGPPPLEADIAADIVAQSRDVWPRLDEIVELVGGLTASVGCPTARMRDLIAMLERADYQQQLLPIFKLAWIEVQRAGENPS